MTPAAARPARSAPAAPPGRRRPRAHSGRRMCHSRVFTVLLLLLTRLQHSAAAAAAAAAAGAGGWQCLSGDRQPSVCFSTTATLAGTPLSGNATTPDECCAACLLVQQCYSWTFSTAEEAGQDRCQLKHILQNGSSSSPACTSGNVKSPLPIAPPPVPAPLPPPVGARNVLFMVVDDLRPQLGTYSAPFPQTPHLDRLAATGLRFDRAYVQWPVCVRQLYSRALPLRLLN